MPKGGFYQLNRDYLPPDFAVAIQTKFGEEFIVLEAYSGQGNILKQMISTFKFILPKIAQTEIINSYLKNLRGQAEKVQLADGTICSFINGATFGVEGERLNYGCDASDTMVIYGDLIEGVVWKAKVAYLKFDDIKKEWATLSTKIEDVAKIWK